MHITYQPAASTQVVALVTLTTPEEAALSDAELLLVVDNHEGLDYCHQTASYTLNGKGLGTKRHFGGRVEPTQNPATKRVTVNID